MDSDETQRQEAEKLRASSEQERATAENRRKEAVEARDNVRDKDNVYDVIQSVFGLGAVFALDFAAPGNGLKPANYALAVMAANVAILVI